MVTAIGATLAIEGTILDKEEIEESFEKATLTGRNRVLKQQNESLQMEVEKRSRWAEERERERKEEVKRRKTWVSSLEDQLRGKALELEHEQ